MEGSGAQALDQPVRTVLPDLALQAIAHRPPSTAEALGRIRGLEGRGLRPGVAAEVLEAIERGRNLAEAELRVPPVDDVPKELRAPVALVMAWVAQLGRDERIDASLLATRGDVALYLRGDRRVSPLERLAGDHGGRTGESPGGRAGRPRL